MKERLRVAGLFLIWTMVAAVAAVPALAAQEGHLIGP